MGSKGGTPPSPTDPAPPRHPCPPVNREVNSVFSSKLCNPPFPNNLPTVRPPYPPTPATGAGRGIIGCGWGII